MSDSTLTAELKRYLEEEALFRFDDQITEHTDLFKAGVLDSFGYISLMNHVRARYGAELGDDMLDNVQVSLHSIVARIEANRAPSMGGR
jgi:D-alanine--poly(phosphoribitol) ligase subunit 2